MRREHQRRRGTAQWGAPARGGTGAVGGGTGAVGGGTGAGGTGAVGGGTGAVGGGTGAVGGGTGTAGGTVPPSDAGPGLFAAFGDGGWTTGQLGSLDEEAFAAALQPDGRIVVAGRSLRTGGNDFLVLRLLADGRLDPSFNGTGRVVLDFDGGEDQAHAVLVQPDGRIVVAGFSNGLTGSYAFTATRLTSTGGRDPSFGDRFYRFGPASSDNASAMLQQPDGKLVLAGLTTNPINRWAVMRLLGDGSLDPGFADAGQPTFFSAQSGCASLLLRPDGRLVLGGWSFNGISVVRPAWVGLLPDGTNDPTLPPSVRPLAGGFENVTAMTLDPAGGIVSALSSRYVVRFVPDGGPLDPTFGDGGRSGLALPALAVDPLPDGRLAMAGHTDDVPTRLYVGVLAANGRLSFAFDGGGLFTWSAPFGDAHAYAQLVNPDGTVVVVGGYGSDAGHRAVVLKVKP
ncbi:MAG: hypothetical protein IPJ65_01715 [Archangiaceae bacterium]|nr:hypothetical protein [Archangiaceae bacterium]